MKKKKRIISILLAAILLLGIGSGIYLSDYYKADDMAVRAMAYQGNDVQVEENGNEISFIPKTPSAGLIFYPGGKVQCESYAPLMLQCAQNGILVVLVKMPGNLAVLNPSAADGIREKYPDIESWYMGGHSLGGAMAANYIAKHTKEYEGLILLAAYATKDLGKTQLNVLSIYGSEDGVMKRESYEENRSNLPADFEEDIIEGGCHAYFGNYGPQKGDGNPSITNEEQVQQAAEKITDFVKKK